jgi:hypothetical protein
MRDPWLTVRAIDVALKKCLNGRLPNISVELAWNHYKDLLTIKGVEWEPVDFTYWAKHESRPLQVYREKYPLRLGQLNNPNSQVLGRLPDGSVSGWAIYRDPLWEKQTVVENDR